MKLSKKFKLEAFKKIKKYNKIFNFFIIWDEWKKNTRIFQWENNYINDIL